MIDNLIIIIPTHNRQHYLRRVVKYYSSFPCKVYICDSSKERAEIECSDNISYRWVPQSNFYGKVLDVLNETSADFYALSPDDDFLKEETLMGCYEEMSCNSIISLGTGKQVFFDEPFNGSFYLRPGANNLSGFRREVEEKNDEYIKRFWSHYQNILWSIFKKEVIKNAFTALSACNFSNGNFVEIILGIESLRAGDVFVSSEGMNYREVAKMEHWGNSTLPITKDNIEKNVDLNKDISLFYNYFEGDQGFSKLCLDYYLSTTTVHKPIWVGFLGSFLPNSIKSLITRLLLIHVPNNEFVSDVEMGERINDSIAK